jgi:RsiW-degrading membrane proteinase PrsW (M82 family)
MSLFIQTIYLASGLSLLYIFLLYRSNPLRRLPAATVTVTFTLGMAAVIPAALLHRLLPLDGGGPVFSAYVSAGLIEEGIKFLVLAVTIWRFKFPDLAEPIDLAIYFGILGVGFGIYEDFWYIFSVSYDAWTAGDVSRFHEVFQAIAIARSFPGHILFDALAGFLVSHARFLERFRDRVPWLIGGFLLAVGLHGSFNLIATLGGTIPLLSYIVLLIGLFLHLRRRALARSPFRALIGLITKEEEEEWAYPRPPVDYLFAEGFSWPGKPKGGMFQVFPLTLALLILYPLLVVMIYLIHRTILWLVGG